MLSRYRISKTYVKRRNAVLELIANNPDNSFDVCNRDFVDDFIALTGCPYRPTNFGAHKCKVLGQVMARMYREHLLSRNTNGLLNLAGMGFPTWVYSYRMAGKGESLHKEQQSKGCDNV